MNVECTWHTSKTLYYYHNDHLGSARVISDKDGKVVEQYFYYPFGGGGPVGGPTFTGKELDDSGLFYFGARYYDSALGRFITPDPIDIVGSNPYVYCYNNPLVYVDPNGEFAWWAAFLIGGFVSAGITYFETGEFSLESFVIGGMMSLMTYGIAFSGAMDAGVGAGVAETLASNRVIASGITQIIMSTDFVRNELGIDSFWESVFASAFIQAGFETALNWNKNVSLTKASREEVTEALKNKSFKNAGISGRGVIAEGMSDFHKIVDRNGNVLGYISSDEILEGKVPFTTHTGLAIPKELKITPSFMSRHEYFVSGLCHQDVGNALGIIPTQLFSNRIDVWLTVGVYGMTGGPGALPAYLLIQYERYR